MENVAEKKRLFIGLLGISMISVIFIVTAIWYLIFNPQQTLIYKVILSGLVILVAGIILLAGFGLAGILYTLWFSKNKIFFQRPIRIALNTFFPLVLALGKIARIEMDRVRNSFVQVNNQLVLVKNVNLEPEKLLILAPHCIQLDKCKHKITGSIYNCRRCGGCQVNDLLNLKDKYGINIGIATGGTLARKYVQEYRPHAIVAIACERDLSSGILDVNPIPVFGVTNYRPHGPCKNTCICLPMVEEAVQHFIGNGVNVFERTKVECQGISS